MTTLRPLVAYLWRRSVTTGRDGVGQPGQ